MTPQFIRCHHGESLEVGRLVEGENVGSLLPIAITAGIFAAVVFIGDAVVLLLPGGIVGYLKRKRWV